MGEAPLWLLGVLARVCVKLNGEIASFVVSEDASLAFYFCLASQTHSVCWASQSRRPCCILRRRLQCQGVFYANNAADFKPLAARQASRTSFFFAGGLDDRHHLCAHPLCR